ncbi:Fc.00g038540.m01.CDS01 [Cosmosporella sp. VM-42]
MKQAYECGINFFDTAESYDDGESEIVMGQVITRLGRKRDDIVVSTKLNWSSANGEILVKHHEISRKHVVEGLRLSLNRLGLEYVDIVYAHRPDRLTPIEETVRAFNHVIERGWAFYWGTSEWSSDEITEACGVARELLLIPPIIEQPQYNMLERRRVESEYQRLYSRFVLGLTVFSPMKMGLLSGKYNNSPDKSPAGSRFAESNDKFSNLVRARGTATTSGSWPSRRLLRSRHVFKYAVRDHQSQILTPIKIAYPIAEQLGVTQSQLALAWCLKNENVSSAITGASKPEQIVENFQALQVADKVTREIMTKIDEIAGKIELDPARED